MGIIDIIIVLALLPALYFGFKNGFVKQLVAIAVIFIGVWASLRFSDTVSKWLIDRFALASESSEVWIKIASFAIIFIVVAIVLNLLSRLVEKILKITMLGWVNRLLGIVFCLIKFAFIIGLILYVVDSANGLLNFIPQEKIDESMIYKPILDFINSVFPYLKQLFAKS